MNREIIRVEPLSTYLENWKAPASAVTRAGDKSTSPPSRPSTPTPAKSPTRPSSGRPN